MVSTTGIPFPVLWKELLLSPCSLISLVLMEIRNLIQSNLNSNNRIAPFKVVTSAHNKLQISDNLTLKEIGVKLCTNRWVMWTLLHQNYSSEKTEFGIRILVQYILLISVLSNITTMFYKLFFLLICLTSVQETTSLPIEKNILSRMHLKEHP